LVEKLVLGRLQQTGVGVGRVAALAMVSKSVTQGIIG